MKIIDVKSAPLLENPHRLKARRILDREYAQAIHITLGPGETLPRHATPVDVFFYLLRGRGVVEIGDEERAVGPDTLVDSPAGVPHRWRNEGRAALELLVVKTPRPKD